MESKAESYRTELKRQLAHALGIFVVILLLLLKNEELAIKILAILTCSILIASWYMTNRSLREKYYQKLIHQLKSLHYNVKEKKTSASDIEEKYLWGFLKNFLRQRERWPLIASFWSLFSALIAAVLFGLPYAILGLLVLSVGDAFSTIIGKKWGKSKIFWCPDKSWVGFAAFVVSTLIAGIIFLKYFPQFAIINPAILVVLMALAGALIETIPLVDDNSTIPIGVALIIWLAATFS